MSDSPPDERVTSRLDIGIALAIATTVCALYAATLQTHYWGDGRPLVLLAETDTWRFAKPGYLPLYHALALPAEWFGVDDALTVLLALSVGTGALAAAATYLAARAQRSARVSSVAAAALLASSPSVWFFSTCVEVHAPHLLMAALGTWWIAHARRRGTLGKSAWPIVGLLALVIATHPTGGFWVPAAALVLFQRADRRWRELAVLGVGLAVLFAAYRAITPPQIGAFDTSPSHVISHTLSLFADWNLSGAWVHFGIEMGALTLVALLWLLTRPARRAPDLRSYAPAIALACAPFIALLPGHPVFERGAHYFGILPLVALGGASLLDRIPSRTGAALVAIVLTVGSSVVALHRIDEWQTAYPGHEWIEPLKEEMGDSGPVLTGHTIVQSSIARHSEMVPGILRGGTMRIPPATFAKTLDGERLAITCELWESEDPTQRAWLDALAGELGAPTTGARDEYLFFPTK